MIETMGFKVFSPPALRMPTVYLFRAVAAHDAHDALVATREIDGARLGPLQKHAHAIPRFSGLLAVRTMEEASCRSCD
jgi:hypothetical protein